MTNLPFRWRYSRTIDIPRVAVALITYTAYSTKATSQVYSKQNARYTT